MAPIGVCDRSARVSVVVTSSAALLGVGHSPKAPRAARVVGNSVLSPQCKSLTAETNWDNLNAMPSFPVARNPAGTGRFKYE